MGGYGIYVQTLVGTGGWMMKRKIGIISDTHGLLRTEVTEGLRGCEAILHGGDINREEILTALREIAPTYAVRGNNDGEWAAHLPGTLSVSLCGVHFFMAHNKKYIPKETDGADVIIYGHSHKYEEKYAGGQLWLNPGSCGPRRFTQPITFALLEIGDDGSFRAEKVEIAHQVKQSGAGGAGRDRAHRGIPGGDMKKIVRAVMRDTDKHIPVSEIAAKNRISEELAEQICRLYLTHPGVGVDSILGKMGM